ncbi:hypothetical protein NX059_004273 [Plenodomus lindquistii]|nr:hypothetical protein NX059_004273 [Plenodomus lindquistii]
MPPRPFPLPLHIGNDICSISRIRKLITRNRGDTVVHNALNSFLLRILTPPEVQIFWKRFGRRRDISQKTDAVAQYLAGRFAAKEACRKACPHWDRNHRGFQQIIILPSRPKPQALILDAVYAASQSKPRLDSSAVVQEDGEEEEEVEQQDRDPDDDEEEEAEEEESSSIGSHDDTAATTLEALDGQIAEISISHDGEYATAVAIVPRMEGSASYSDS